MKVKLLWIKMLRTLLLNWRQDARLKYFGRRMQPGMEMTVGSQESLGFFSTDVKIPSSLRISKGIQACLVFPSSPKKIGRASCRERV